MSPKQKDRARTYLRELDADQANWQKNEERPRKTRRDATRSTR